MIWVARGKRGAGRAGPLVAALMAPLVAPLMAAAPAGAEERRPAPAAAQAEPSVPPAAKPAPEPQAAPAASPSPLAVPGAQAPPAAPRPAPAPSSAPVAGPAATPPVPKAPAPLRTATISSDPRPTLQPETFIATTRAADHYLQLAENGGWPSLPAGTALKVGDHGAAVALLRRRLAATGDLAPELVAGPAFDAVVAAAVKRFQGRHGLPETGLVGARTLAALNVPAVVRYRQLTASAGRLLGSAFAFGERYVVVNIPAATVEAVEGGQVARRYVAVVGKKDRASPRVETRITNVNFNPTWTVPTSLIRKDIIPHMRKDPTYLAKHRIRILDGQGREVDPTAIDWSTERAVNFTLRQDPHAGNSLGQVRIDMPNRHAVYMHDTPTKRLFALDARFHSSGCVRVADVRSLVEWLLRDAAPQSLAALQAAPGAPAPAAGATASAALFGTGGWAAEDVEAAIASGRRLDVKLARPVPVAWVYLTGYATPDGTVHFRDDVYDLDVQGGAAPPAPDDTRTSALPPRRPAAPPAAAPRAAEAAPRRAAKAPEPAIEVRFQRPAEIPGGPASVQ